MAASSSALTRNFLTLVLDSLNFHKLLRTVPANHTAGNSSELSTSSSCLRRASAWRSDWTCLRPLRREEPTSSFATQEIIACCRVSSSSVPHPCYLHELLALSLVLAILSCVGSNWCINLKIQEQFSGTSTGSLASFSTCCQSTEGWSL